MTLANRMIAATLAAALTVAAAGAWAHSYRERNVATPIADTRMTVTPPRDWNRLSGKPGKVAETWTLDGEQLNDVTFYAGVEPGDPLVRERNRKRAPLPKFTGGTLLAEIPELLEGTYRALKGIGTFAVTSSQPGRFLDHDAVTFAYDYLDSDQLPRRGEAVATIIDKRLYMVTFDAPRLHYFDKGVGDYHALVAATRLAAPPATGGGR